MKKVVLCFLVGIGVNTCFSQIIVDWTEIPHTIGTQWVKNTRPSVTVDLGTTGGPQTWSFTAQPMGPENDTIVIVTPSSSPFIDSFTNVNLVYMQQELTDVVYQHYGLYAAAMVSYGLGGTSMGDQWLWKYVPPDSSPLPIQYGDSRHFHFYYTIEVVGTDSVTYEHYGWQVCDAYGSVTIPYNTFECLRVCDFDTCVMTMFDAGYPVFFDTTTHIRHSFVAENYDGVVCVLSLPDETNQHFTSAQALERLVDFSTSIQEVNDVVIPSLLHYPTPFSDRVTITYTLNRASDVSIHIYNVIGELVRTFSGAQPAGVHTIVWDGIDEYGHRVPGGIYVYRAVTGDVVTSGKMVLVD
jgi:hypothetical protein